VLFGHKFEFPCVKQPTNSTMDAYYDILYMRVFMQDQRRKWGIELANGSDDKLREEFARI
jgi:hypothetical protein